MSEEIDLRVYAQALRRRWWIVAIFVVAAVAAAFVISALQPRHYEAVATLTATAPRFQWRFDMSVQPVVDTRRDYQREFLAIAKSNDIAVRAAELLSASEETSTMTPGTILSSIAVRTGDANTLLVTATADDPRRAATLANTYAQAFVEVGQRLSGVSADLASFRSELAIAEQEMIDAEQAATDARTATGYMVVSGSEPSSIELQNPALRQLDLKTHALAETRNDLDGIRYLVAQLEAAEPGADLSRLPWEMLDGPVLRLRGLISPTGALQSLDDPQALLATLRNEEAALAASADLLAQESATLTRQAAEDWRTYSKANRSFTQARDVYSILIRKVSEAEIQERIDPSQLTVVSAALEPTKPTQTRQLALYAAAGVIGLILGVIVALWSGLRAGQAKPPNPAPTQG